MNNIEKHISPYIANQLPRLYREEGPLFISFLKAYFEFMEQDGEVLNESRSLFDYRDIDTTLPEFIQFFRDKYMTGVPDNVQGDAKTLQKHIKEIYSSKGTIRGLELVFRLLSNEAVEVYYPGDDLLKPSDGVWVKPTYLEVSINPMNVLLIGEQVTGRESGATAIVEDFQSRYINKRQINILYLSNVRGTFKTGELLLNNVIEDPLRSPAVIGSLTGIQVNESGFDYRVGDVLEVIGGSGVLGQAVVSNTSSRSGAVEFIIQNGGSGYANDNVWAPTTVEVTAIDANNPGIGATFSVGRLGDTEVITTAVDTIAPYENVSLDSADYGFHEGSPVVNINTPLDQALNIQDITVGTILSIRAINPGAGYNGPVVVTVRNDVIAGLEIDDDNGSIKGNNAVVIGNASSGSGAIDAVKIIDSGFGYRSGDVVTLQNANNEFIAGGSVVLGQQGIGSGFWKDTRSFLNSDKYIQDSFYYQEYSFEVRAALAFQSYADIVKKLWQPAGTEAFGKVVVASEIDSVSLIEEVAIDAIFITEYITSFNTLVTTDRTTDTLYDTFISTTYPTTIQTATQRSTTTTLLDTIPERVVNGNFDLGISNWSAFDTSDVTWDGSNQRIAIERASGDGSASQGITTVPGRTYYVQVNWADATVGFNAYASNSEDPTDQIETFSQAGAAGSAKFSFVAQAATTYIILAAQGSDGDVVYADTVSIKELPETSRATQYDTNVATVTEFATSLVTNQATGTIFDTIRSTEYTTQRITLSAFGTDRTTNRATASIYNTTFDTTLLTNQATATNRITAIQTNRVTATGYITAYNTFFATNRTTNTLGTTSYQTNRVTSADTSTVYDTVLPTNVLTSTTIGTNRATSASTDTTKSTSYVTQFGTSYATLFNTTTAFDTSRTTAFATTYSTAYASVYVTQFATNRNTTESRSTNRATGTSAITSKNTATSRATSRSTGTSRSTTTSYDTTTTFNTTYSTYLGQVSTGPNQSKLTDMFIDTTRSTNRATAESRATTTSFDTTTAYSTIYDTSTQYVTAFNTTTTYTTSYITNTSFITSDVTSRDTTRNTSADTSVSTAFQTSRSTGTSAITSAQTSAVTTKNTTFATTTAYVTSFNTVIDTETLFNTLVATQRSTGTTGDTVFDTTVATLKSTLTAFDTLSPTSRTTVVDTDTAFLTDIATVFDTTTAFVTSFNTSRSTQVATTTVFVTAFDTNTLRVTDVVTTRNTLFATNRTTDTAFDTTYLTNVATTSTFVTEIVTTYVDVPTTFQTTFDTSTDATTDYQTGVETDFVTSTDYDTEYATARITSINTATDLTE